MEYIIFKDVEKSYGENKVLKKTNLSIKKGELVTLLGPSGCGKSTLLRCLAGLESLTSGKIYLDSEDITQKRPGERNIGMVFQEYSLFPSMTVYKNIAYGLKMNKFPKKDMDRKIKEALKMTDLEGKETKYPSQLSGGEKQRVALARSIVTEPKVLLLDEPLSAIDAKLRRALQDRIREINKELNMTSIFVTHDQEEAMRISDTIHIMNNGKIEQSGEALDIYTNPKTLFTAGFIGNYNILEKAIFENVFKVKTSSNYIAIRPEKIKLESKDFKYRVKARLIDIMSLGNVIRYSFEIGETLLKVDVLNEEGKIVEKNSEVILGFEEEDLIYLGG